MTHAADLLFRNAEVHTLVEPDATHEALAIRDGRIVRVGKTYEIEFLEGVETDVIDCEGRVVLPGFVDAHTHMETLGRYLVHADLSGAGGPDDCVEHLRESADERGDHEWILGFGYDESRWDAGYLTSTDLDRVSGERPVAAFREDMHVASLNTVARERYEDDMPTGDVKGDGVIVEEAVDVVYEAIAPGPEETRELLVAAGEYANARGVTGVHDMVRNSHAPRVYRDLDDEDTLTHRVRINYWSDHLDAVSEAGLRTNHGSEMVRTGAIKTYTDGSFGGRTAKLTEPYEGGGTGQWVVPPEELRELIKRADGEGYQLSVHAIGDRAIEETLDAMEIRDDPGAARHRIEHAELLSEEAIERFAESGIVASVQPNFLKWAGDGGLYDDRLGDERRTRTNRYRDLLDAGARLAFGSDCMPLDPLLGVHHAVTASEPSQRLSVTEALRAYTSGAAYAGFDEHRLGTAEPGKLADLVVLEESPWENDDRIDDIEIATTLVDGTVVYDAR
ncbi:amidohydrolase [Halalkalicoccus jeotgali]|uniref:Amidohydrolase 3 n=1 Tax=Halalkalicoccus jeotgali (strain DSM 18796 / CECT 7217 / JCM 14584 / KCTC 4019 / B3) TaxID=795797 RepID=D8JAJ0_HALJB|nr:amidohydrolase [Halalkalicoccus jeotgali]ADJ14712.1 Amidohydrolase 3 [Halalkalicoccus jeotgali B3]ELY39508.1 Amidohydrolase 3 [Halalkalicoccus jeotgali B3]